jgi:hypothetical protein
MIVPMPPMAAAVATPNNKALLIPDRPREVNSGVMAVTTIDVVAESDMNMAATQVVNIKAFRIF